MPRCLAVASALFLISGSACVEYLPAPETAIAPSRDVRILLTETGQRQLAPQVGMRVAAIDAGIERATTDSIELRVLATVDEAGLTTRWTGERLHMSRAFVTGVRTRQVSRTRSWLLAGAIVTVGGLLAGTFASEAFSANRQGGGQGPAR
jgi:hypothetical protein